jgi:RHS repeat-associated protein
MPAQTSIRVPDDSMTPSFACLLSAASANPSISSGKERDAESGNDYFGARCYSSAMGRFMSPDWSAQEEPVPYATMDDPQSLNLYSYVRNNPLTRADADGHFDWDSAIVSLSTAAGGVAGTFVGAAVGAGVGTLALPGGGTVGGGIWGGALGGTAGAVIGNSIGKGIVNALNSSSSNQAPAPAPAASPAPDFVVTPGGTAVATDPNRVAGSLVGAPGVTSTPVQSPSGEQGTLHTGVQTPNGPVDVRTMGGSKTNTPRTVITHPGTSNPKTPDGKATNDKGQSHIPSNSKIPKPQQ